MSGSKLGWNHPVCSTCPVQNFWMESSCMFNLSVLHVWFKTFILNRNVCSTCQYFMSGLKLLDVITLYVQLVSTSCLVHNFWIEPPCMFNLSVLHVWLKTFGWIHPVCSTCQFFMPGSKLLNRITLYVQIVCSSCLVQNFWMEIPCMFNLSTSCLVQKFWIESPCMFNLSMLHVWFKILDGIFM